MSTAAVMDAAAATQIAVVERSGFVESRHLGAAVVVDAAGGVLEAHGDVRGTILPRSTLKPFQTVAALRAGARFDDEELAVVSASHVGAPEHLAVVHRVLAESGLGDDALRTPSAWPGSASAARDLARAGGGPMPIAMNCSGNHAGMLAAASAAGWSTDDYLDPAHPVHRLAHHVVAELTGSAPGPNGTDGCGGPVWGLTLAALAAGYARLAGTDPDGRRIAAAVRAHPDLVEGRGSPTSRAVAELGVFAKAGAEGISVMVAASGITAAVKCLDGGQRAVAAVAVALLARHGAIDAAAAARYLAAPDLVISGGADPVGRIRVTV